MGKKDKKKKDPEKKAQLQAKKEAKADKAARKRLNKELGKSASNLSNDKSSNANENNDNNNNDIDSLIASYTKTNLDSSTPIIEKLVDGTNGNLCFPSPRANFSWTVLPDNDILMFGGEYYNGVENMVYDDLYIYNPDATLDSDDDEKETNANPKHKIAGEWKQIFSPTPRPAARCAHSSVLYRDDIYIFGGELATSDEFHHYRDMWKFNLKSNTWQEIRPRGSSASTIPSPRSGHRCLVWRHYMILFGGFYEALRETKWFNDLWVYDFKENVWMECKYGKLASVPSPRSAFSFGLHPSSDTAYIYGGFSKVKNPGSKAEGKTHTDCWALHLKPILTYSQSTSNKPPTWERTSRKGEYPSQRSSCSSAVYKQQKLLVFGGVQDEERDHHGVDSMFFDDLFTFDMERRRWYTLGLKKVKGKGGRRRKKNAATNENHESDDEEEDDDNNAMDSDASEDETKEGEAQSSGWDLDKLRANMFAFIDGDGNIVYEKIEPGEGDDGYQADADNADPKAHSSKETLDNNDDDDDDDSDEEEEEKDEEKEEETPKKEEEPKKEEIVTIKESQVMKLNSSGIPVPVSRLMPLPRINASMVIRNNTLYLFGGLLEVGNRETTLDDCWTLDLQKRNEWNCIYDGTMHQQVWKGVESDDNESYISTDVGMGDDDDDDDDYFLNSENEDDEENDDGGEQDAEAIAAKKAAKKKKKKEEKKKMKNGIKMEIERLKEQLDLDDDNRTPQLGEAVAEFYARTSQYWTTQAIETLNTKSDAAAPEQPSEKELKRIGFTLARERFDELKPVLERLNELDGQQQEAEDDKKDRKEKKKSSKSKSSQDGGSGSRRRERRH